MELSQNNLQACLEKEGISSDNINKTHKLYKSIFKMNKNVNETIDFNMFDSKISNIFNLEKMARITTYPEMQEKIVSLIKIQGFDSIIRAINDENWVMELDNVLKNNEQIENLNPILKKYSSEDRKRFAIIEMMYGIDYEENKTIIDNELEEIEYTNIADLEANCINMYSQMYKETLYIPKENDRIKEVEYEGTKIDIYEISEDFNMFIRAEGAKYGYSLSEDGTLLLSAPWNIMSDGANKEFSIASEKWDLNAGIQFRTPKEMINNTRHSYNEFDFEKLIYNEKEKREKYNPDNIFKNKEKIDQKSIKRIEL